MEINLTQTEIHRCAKCNHVTNIRHHMGCDRYFGRFYKPFARNYKKYLYCVYLCVTCHAIIHVIYKSQGLLSMRSRNTKKAKENMAKYRRKQCIDVCRRWLAGEDFGITKYDYKVSDLLRKWMPTTVVYSVTSTQDDLYAKRN